MINKTKICCKCKIKKPISEFHKDRITKDGLHPDCKECRRKFYKRNREKILKYHKEYREKNREKLRERNQKWRENNPIKVWCDNSVGSHKDRGFDVRFKRKDLYIIAKKIKNCPICDRNLDWDYGTGINSNTPTLDRKYNENFLTLDNTWIICKRCNESKSDRTIKELI